MSSYVSQLWMSSDAAVVPAVKRITIHSKGSSTTRFPRRYSDPFSLSLTPDSDRDSPLSFFHSSSLSSTSSFRSLSSLSPSHHHSIKSSYRFPRPPKPALLPLQSRATAKGTFYLDEYTFQPWFNSMAEAEQASMEYWADDESLHSRTAPSSMDRDGVDKGRDPLMFWDSPDGSFSSLFHETTDAFHPSHPRLRQRTSEGKDRRESEERSGLVEVGQSKWSVSTREEDGEELELDDAAEEEGGEGG